MRRIKWFLSFILIVSVAVSFADRYKRPMQIHKVKKIGLEIWTELEPEWQTELMNNGTKPLFVAHTPMLTYPPSGMIWVNHAEVILKPNEFKGVAHSTLMTAAKNYQVSKDALKNLKITPAKYGVLKGFEVDFVGWMDNKQVDVKVFTGRANDKGPITMQVYTTEGKLKHLQEQIRRSWTHTRYLD